MCILPQRLSVPLQETKAPKGKREAKEEVLETVVEKKGSEEGLLVVRAEPLEQAQRICNNLVDGVRVVNGALLVEVDPDWAKAINAVLVERGELG